jgi:hypothetical protein
VAALLLAPSDPTDKRQGIRTDAIADRTDER